MTDSMLNARVLVTGFCLSALMLAACESRLDKAMAAYEAEQHADALRLLKPLARDGDADAQYLLANVYREGRGVAADPVKAADWAQLSAAQGNLEAQFALAQAYERGVGVPINFRQAVRWYETAANGGYGEAHLKLHEIYSAGIIVEKNEELAGEWRARASGNAPDEDQEQEISANPEGERQEQTFTENGTLRDAAEKGDAVAQFNLGVRYANGEGVAKDDAEAPPQQRRSADLADAAVIPLSSALTEILIARRHPGGDTGQRTNLSFWWHMLPFTASDEPGVLRCVYQVESGRWFYFWHDSAPGIVKAASTDFPSDHPIFAIGAPSSACPATLTQALAMEEQFATLKYPWAGN